MTTKTELRSSLSSDVAAFLANGGTVTVGKTVSVRRRNSASGKQKLRFGWAEPKNRPSNTWDNIEFAEQK